MIRKLRKAQQKVDKLKEQKAPRKMLSIIGTGDHPEEAVEKKEPKNRTPALLRIATTLDGDDTGCTRGLKPLPPFLEKGAYESEDQFLNRISRLSSQAMTEAKLEERFGLDFCPVLQPQMMSTRSGKVVAIKKRRKKKKGLTLEQRAENKRAKRRERDAKRRCKKKRGSKSDEKTDGFEQFSDEVRFGDIVTAPPAFSKRKHRM